MASVTLKNICKSYNKNFQTVKNINIDIKDKEFIVLVGPSGCGKSTTLRMIAGLEEITSGELYIGDKLVNDIHPKDRDIAMVFQNYALYPHLSVYENMAFALKIRKTPKSEIENKVKEAAKILDLEKVLDRKPKDLSGGQRQRVALGRAIVRNPKVFLMDEPLSNLDAKLRTSMRAEISKLHKTLDSTFIYVTHDQVEAMTMADRIVVLRDGEVQQMATPQEVYDNPSNMFVAGFIGSPQINFINVTIKEENGKLYAVNSELHIALNNEASSVLTEKGYINKEVILGVRPEHIHNEESFVNDNEDTAFEALIDFNELMGSEIYCYLKSGDLSITARFEGKSKLTPGDTIKLAIDKEELHIFDKETELTIV